MGESQVAVKRSEVLAFRRRVGALDGRLPSGADSFRQAAWVGLQDSMPRAALLSLHARVEGITETTLDDPSLVQVWGPRHSVYVIARDDLAVFTLGRLPTATRGRRRAEETAERLRGLLEDGDEIPYGEAGRALDVHPNSLRYAAPTGSLVLRWDGARQPTIQVVEPPDVDPRDARHELARRYLQAMGPTTPGSFARWAGVAARHARTTFDELGESLVPVRTPIGDGWILADDQDSLHASHGTDAPVRLLPSGDAYWLLQDDERDLLVNDPVHRDRLWTPRVWPGALLVDGEVVGTWRRAHATFTVDPWRTLTAAERVAVEAEAAALPLPGIDGPVAVDWDH